MTARTLAKPSGRRPSPHVHRRPPRDPGVGRLVALSVSPLVLSMFGMGPWDGPAALVGVVIVVGLVVLDVRALRDAGHDTSWMVAVGLLLTVLYPSLRFSRVERDPGRAIWRAWAYTSTYIGCAVAGGIIA